MTVTHHPGEVVVSCDACDLVCTAVVHLGQSDAAAVAEARETAAGAAGIVHVRGRDLCAACRAGEMWRRVWRAS